MTSMEPATKKQKTEAEGQDVVCSEDMIVDRVGSADFESPLDQAETVWVDPDSRMLMHILARKDGKSASSPPVTLELAGPRKKLFMKPSEVVAAIVTCGGPCPGINDVVRGLVVGLHHEYKVKEILGIRYGFRGLVADNKIDPMVLTPDVTKDWHNFGGTALGTSRGPQPIDKMVAFMKERKINALFCIGGDGTLRGARAIYEQVKREKLPIAIVGIPKTIDNDITFIDHTFGFNTAVNLAQLSIETAHAEARSHENGIGLVKLMGRDSGFIAVYASLASGDVNLCLIPEVKFSVSALLNWLEKRLARKSHAVIVVAEGAGQDLCFTKGGGTDASGNVKLVDIGLWLKNEIQKGMAQRKVDITLKYIDPSYTIRSSKASCSDRVYCIELAHAAIHAALHGCTGLMVSNINGRFCHVPLVCGKQKRKVVDTAGVAYQSLLLNSGMPLHLGGEGVASSKL